MCAKRVLWHPVEWEQDNELTFSCQLVCGKERGKNVRAERVVQTLPSYDNIISNEGDKAERV